MWKGEMPSNIALIKYMGKKEGGMNLPTNSSLSWTLDHLTTQVILKPAKKNSWLPLETPYPFEMSQVGRTKYLNHLESIKKHFGVTENFEIWSGNNFPADCGIASSASSFAALTEAASIACSEISGKTLRQSEKAFLSSKGSGSSCRSFFKGWVQWDGELTQAVDLNLGPLQHMVVLAGEKAKTVSSSQAHKMVSSSLLFSGRVERAECRLKEFSKKAQEKDWAALFQISWEEFWDMHALFETSHPAFGYFEPSTLTVLNSIRTFWDKQGDGPLVTMDAGPNVHLLWREDQVDLPMAYFDEYIKNNLTCLTNIEDIGFAKV